MNNIVLPSSQQHTINKPFDQIVHKAPFRSSRLNWIYNWTGSSVSSGRSEQVLSPNTFVHSCAESNSQRLCNVMYIQHARTAMKSIKYALNNVRCRVADCSTTVHYHRDIDTDIDETRHRLLQPRQIFYWPKRHFTCKLLQTERQTLV